ncbi:Arf GTPase arf1 [Bonamia ostreae]|uniref:Arf GTPase arf1 n=1 Tax=Bonamia ostreae TaxID=126728 RepID=A0ABV2AKK1_9EUKA
MGNAPHKSAKKVILIGPEGSGKSTVFNYLTKGRHKEPEIDLKFSQEFVHADKAEISVWDMPGNPVDRHMWRHHFQQCYAIVFVVDSSNPEKLGEARALLQGLQREDSLENSRLLVLANKQDKANAIKAAELSKLLRLADLQMPFKIVPCVAASGKGVDSGIELLLGSDFQ